MKRRRLQRFWVDLKRRRLFSTGAFYVVVAWAFVQVASIAFPVFGIPAAYMRAVLVAAFAGFPVVLVLAWVFDVTRSGIRVTEPIDEKYPQNKRPPRWWVRPLVAAPLLALIVGGTAWLWSARLSHTGDTEFTQQVRPDELPIVAVLPLENLTGPKDLAWTGAAVASLVRDDLAQSHFIAVVSAARTMRLVGDNKDMQSLLASAAQDGITHVLSGEVLRTPKGLTVTSRLTDLRRNVELGANRQEALQPEDALSFSTAIASVVKQGLGLPGTEKVDVFAADFAAHNVAAYEAFIAGMQNFLAFDYSDARQAFEAAVQKAPDFAMARYRLAHTLASLGNTEGALRQIEAAKRAAVRLPSRDRAYIAAADAYFRRDYAQAERQYRDLLEQHPYESEARLLLLYVLIDQGRNDEALVEAETLTQKDPGDEVAWSSVADLNLKLDHYDAADAALAKLIAISPDNPYAYYLLGESRLFRGQYDDAAVQYRKALQADAGFGDAALRLADIEVLRNRPQVAVAQLQPLLAPGKLAPSMRITAAFNLAALLRAQGRCADALAALDRVHADIAAEKVRQALELATRSRCLLDQHDVAQARQLAAEAVRQSPGSATRYLFTRGLAEIEARDVAATTATIAAIRALATTDVSDRTEQKAADELLGLLRLQQGDVAGAVTALRSAVTAKGYEYDAYALALARALVRQGNAREARTFARQAAMRGSPTDLRLDLEPSRHEAAQLLAHLGG
jgi:TolB-like protein/predicted Zn-dependent protease